MGDRQEEKPDSCEESILRELGTVDFSTFILSLGTSVLYNLDQRATADEEGTAEPANLSLARHVIDIITMLQEKTRGNLSEDEANLVETLLFDLRLKYVNVCKDQGAPKTDGSD